jgi:hypothetical protein
VWHIDMQFPKEEPTKDGRIWIDINGEPFDDWMSTVAHPSQWRLETEDERDNRLIRDKEYEEKRAARAQAEDAQRRATEERDREAALRSRAAELAWAEYTRERESKENREIEAARLARIAERAARNNHQ